MTKKLLLTVILFLISIFAISQDVVYDPVRGDQSRWMRVKGGPNEDKVVHLVYENLGILTKSKVLAGAGILDGLVENTHYKMYHFDYDTLTFEIKTDEPINCIVYRYFYNDARSSYFVGFRKAETGDNMFDGKYMLITPLIRNESITKIYDGIGANRTLVLTLKPEELSEIDVQDFQLGNTVTLQGIRLSRDLRSSITEDFVTYINEAFYNDVEVWPTPVNDVLNIRIPDNPGVMVRIYNVLPMLVYQKYTNEIINEVNFSLFKQGVYIIVISNDIGMILKTLKIVKI